MAWMKRGALPRGSVWTRHMAPCMCSRVCVRGCAHVCVHLCAHVIREIKHPFKDNTNSLITCTSDLSFLCVDKTQRRCSNKIYKTELTNTRYNHQVLNKYRVDTQRAGLTLIPELTRSNLGLKRVLNKKK